MALLWRGLQGDAQDPLLRMKAGLFPCCSPEVCTAGNRGISPERLLAGTWIPLETKPTPSPPQGPCAEEARHQRLRGSHISFNSNIRVLNIQRARGQGGIYSASKYTASTDRDKLKTAQEEKRSFWHCPSSRCGRVGQPQCQKATALPPGASWCRIFPGKERSTQ